MYSTEWQESINMEDHFKGLIMHFSAPIFVLEGPELNITYANNSILYLIKKNPEEVLNKPIKDIIPQLTHVSSFYLLDEVMQSGNPHSTKPIEFHIQVNETLKSRYFSFTYHNISSGPQNVNGILAIGNEIPRNSIINTRNEIIYQKVVHNLSQGFFLLEVIYDPYHNPIDLRFLDANPYFEKIIGIKEIQGKRVLELNPSPDKKWFRFFHNVVRSGNTLIEKFSDTSGKLYEVKAISANNYQNAVIGILTDLDENINSKEASKVNFNEIKQIFVKRTKELERSNAELQQFAYVASHDLKEPIRKIKSYTSMLIDEYDHVMPDRARDFIHKVEEATDRMNNLIEGVLNYSSSSAAKHLITKVDLNEVMLNVINDLELLIQNKKAEIRYQKMPTIEGAPILIYQLFYNLINNSLKYSRDGILCSIYIDSDDLIINGQHYCEVIIRDNGQGFHQENAEKIFQTFTRLHNGNRNDGTGLGLALCKKIVLWHSGFIAAKGIKDEGASFRILLPLSQKKDHHTSTS